MIGGALGVFLSGMRYDAPGAFALPGMPGGSAAMQNMKWYRQLWEGIKDMGAQGYRSARVFPFWCWLLLTARVLVKSELCLRELSAFWNQYSSPYIRF